MKYLTTITLVAALSRHQVIFSADEFMPGEYGPGALLLQLDWLDATPAAAERYQALLDDYQAASARYGVTRLASSAGTMANQGLEAEVTEVEPPQAMELWHMRDAHGFYDDSRVQETNRKIEALVNRSAAFWLELRPGAGS